MAPDGQPAAVVRNAAFATRVGNQAALVDQ